MCLNVSCPLDFPRTEYESKCVLPEHKHTNAIDGTCCIKQQSWIVFNTMYPTGTYIKNELIPCFFDLLNKTGKDIDFMWETIHYIEVVTGFVMLKNNNSVCNLVPDLDSIFTEFATEVQSCGVDSIEYLHMCDKYPIKESCKGQWFNGTSIDFVLVNGTSVADVFLYQDKLIIPELILHDVSYSLDEDGNRLYKNEKVHVCGEETNVLTCPSVTLFAGQHEIVETHNNTKELLIANKTLKQAEFVAFPDGRLLVCAESFLEIATALFSYSGVLDTVDTIGNSVSLMSLAIHLALRVIYSDLRNFHGYCMMSLCVTMFFAQLLPLVSSKVLFEPSWCKVSAIMSHYAWLATFTWMTIIGGNLFHLFIFRPMQRREDRESSYVFRFYLPTFGFGLPLVVVVVCITIHYLKSDNLFLEYGASPPCWITNETANLIAFGVPVAIFLGMNMIFFLAIIVACCLGQQRSRQLQGHQTNVVRFLDIVLCLKVSV